MAAVPPACDFGWKASDFTLPGTDGQMHSLTGIAGPRGTLVMFICNHCPFVLAVVERLVRDGSDLQALGVGVAAISANDPAVYPADSLDNMKLKAAEWRLPFPYLFDETQEVAKAYGAACTPDFFGFNADFGLQYRGRLDASRRETGAADLRRDLFEAMKQVAETGLGPAEQVPSMGCSIKWKTA